jgi:predicted dehydrogenase
MPKRYRVAVIGFAKGHVKGIMGHFARHPQVEWVAYADVPAAVPEQWHHRSSRTDNMRHAREEIKIPTFYEDWRQLLEKERPELVIFCPENAQDGEVAEAIAARGAHMVTEKPMGAGLPEALRMARAARLNGVELFVNWPTTWSPAVRTAKRLVDEGAIGKVWEFKYRAGSLGPMSHGSVNPDGSPIGEREKGSLWWHRSGTGGGALMDYCCYGACMARWFVGEPAVAAQGLMANLRSGYGSADDNAIITIRFREAIGLLEATWSTVDHGVPGGPIVYGDTGTIVVERTPERQAVKIARGRDKPPEMVDPEPLPEARGDLAKEVLHHLESGEPVHETLDVPLNLDAAAILDAGIRSAQSRKTELVDDGRWSVQP